MINKNKIKVHVLDQEKVKQSIEKQCIDLERLCKNNNDFHKECREEQWKRKPPENPEFAQQELENKINENINIYANMCKRERTYYSKVCVVEDTLTGKFYLNYKGGKKAEGTGAFETLEKAEEWFFKQGR